MDYTIRTVRSDEWVSAKEIRLASLQDPAAPIAFLDTYEAALGRADAFWQERTRNSAESPTVRQFVAEPPATSDASPDAGDGPGKATAGGPPWAGTVTVLVEEPGTTDALGGLVPTGKGPQGHIVAVYVRPEHRGTGLIGSLLEAAIAWAWSVEGLARVRLYVHEDNARAEAAYRKAGFTPSGHTLPVAGTVGGRERELVWTRAPEPQ